MPGLVPGIHVLRTARQGVDDRDKPGHDERREWGPNSVPLALEPADVLLGIELEADAADQIELGFEEVDVVFLVAH